LGFLAAFIFLLHPVQVESVVWISQRKNLLAMLFFLVSFLFYIDYQNSSERKSMLSYISSIVTFAFALLSKSVAVILPLVLLLYDLSYLEKAKRKKWIANKIPYLLLAGAATIITLKS